MLTSKLESDLEDAMYWARRDLLISIMEKTQLISFDWSNNHATIDITMDSG